MFIRELPLQSESLSDTNNRLGALSSISESIRLALEKLRDQLLIFTALVILTIVFLAILRPHNIVPVISFISGICVFGLSAYLVFHIYQTREKARKGDPETYGRMIVSQGVRHPKGDAKKEMEKYRKQIRSILEDTTIDVTKLVEIFSECFYRLINYPDLIAASDILDKLSYEINEYFEKFYGTADGPRTISLKRIADIFDYACAFTSHKAAEDLLKKKQYRKALRFAELYTWALSRCKDYFLCLEACDFAAKLSDDYAQARRRDFRLAMLSCAEFLRIKAFAFSQLAEKWPQEFKHEKEDAYGELPKLFRDRLKFKWTLGKVDWNRLDTKKIPSIFSRDDSKKQNVQVVASLDDSIATIYILHWLKTINAQPVWIIKDKSFTSENLAPKNVRLTILIGGPEAWESNETVSILFKMKWPNEFRDLKAGAITEAGILDIEKNSTRCYMIGGGSKIDTMQAAVDFSQREIIENCLNSNTK